MTTQTTTLSYDSQKQPPTSQRGILLFGLLIAIAGSLWAAFFAEGCNACQSNRRMFGGFNLGFVGLVWYALLFLVALVKPKSQLVRFGIILSAGIHIGLLVFLALGGHACYACITTAIGAFIGASGSIKLHRKNLLIVPLVMLLGMALGFAGFITLKGHGDKIRDSEMAILETQVRQEGPANPGHIRLVLFTREGCEYCALFKKNDLPVLQKKFPNLDVTERTLTGNLASPSIIFVNDAGKSANIEGYMPQVEMYESQIRELSKTSPTTQKQ